MDDNRILHFMLGARRFGLRVSDITEITEIPAPTPVPGSPDEIAGIVELRGRVVTLMDIARIHGVPQDGSPSRIGVQLAPPLDHLGILVPGRVENLETGTASLDPRLSSETDEPEDRGDEEDDAREATLGHEIVVGGRPAYILDLPAHVRLCTMRVRERFRVSE